MVAFCKNIKPWTKWLTFWQTFCHKNIFTLINFTKVCFHCFSEQYISFGLRNGGAWHKQQAITWTKDDPIYQLLHAPPVRNELKHNIFTCAAQLLHCRSSNTSWWYVDPVRQNNIISKHQWRNLRWRGIYSWWRHQMETFSALLAICAGDSPVTGEFPT